MAAPMAATANAARTTPPQNPTAPPANIETSEYAMYAPSM